MSTSTNFDVESDVLAVRYLDGSASPEEVERLDALLVADPARREWFATLCIVVTGLGEVSTAPSPSQGDAESPEINIPPPINTPSLFGDAYHGTMGFFSQEVPLAWLITTVIMGMLLLGAWAIKVTHHQHIAEAPSQSVPSDVRQEMVFVGRITGMVDVKWSDDPTFLPPPGYAHVSLGREYRLDAGLLEITYDSGAKVILQGPCTYEVESTAGGYLALGKLTAKVGKESSEFRGQRSDHYPLSTTHYPLFSVRTPTAIVTDLGTEFGVEVDKAGGSKTHVFQGKVEVRLSGDKVDARAIRLGVGESARVGSDQDQVVRIVRLGATAGLPSSAGLLSKPEAFVRRMPKWVPIELFNTGVGLKEGDPDPHWQIVARSDDPDFQPRQAVVTAAHVNWQSNYAARSQWISTANGPPDVPNVTYTFRTTFELANALPETAVLRGRFLVDNHVQAIRLNGKEVPAPEHRYDQLSWFNEISEFSASNGFVEGANTLEIDVLNGRPSQESGNGPMGLCVELGGHVFSREKGG